MCFQEEQRRILEAPLPGEAAQVKPKKVKAPSSTLVSSVVLPKKTAEPAVEKYQNELDRQLWVKPKYAPGNLLHSFRV